eukprot:3505117-Pyramimonas_sp.AAC.1
MGAHDHAYSHHPPVRHRKRGYILITDQSDTGSVGIFACRPFRHTLDANGSVAFRTTCRDASPCATHRHTATRDDRDER